MGDVKYRWDHRRSGMWWESVVRDGFYAMTSLTVLPVCEAGAGGGGVGGPRHGTEGGHALCSTTSPEEVGGEAENGARSYLSYLSI